MERIRFYAEIIYKDARSTHLSGTWWRSRQRWSGPSVVVRQPLSGRQWAEPQSHLPYLPGLTDTAASPVKGHQSNYGTFVQ